MNNKVSFDDEPLILVDKNGKPIGSNSKLECHLGEGLLHRAFSVFIFNNKSELLLQKRSLQKMLWPSHWSNSCCSHPRLNEDEVSAVHRRILQELGISIKQLHKHFELEYKATYKDVGSEWELCSVFTAVSDEGVNFNPNEIDAIKWVAVNELADMMLSQADKFSPWIKLEWEKLLPLLKRQKLFTA